MVQKYGPKQFDQTMEFNGGANNAYTTENVTVYTDWFPASAAVIFDLEADRISSLSIDPSIVESERGVVLVNVVQVLKILLGDCYRNPCRNCFSRTSTGR
jgi:predicted Zn-dependent peptidase